LPLGKIEIEIPKEAYIINPELITIEKGCIVEPGAYIKGPCWIGKGSTVRHGAYIRGNFICGSDCVTGHDTEIKQAIFLNNVHAAHFAYVGDSILGNRVNLGAGTKCANLKFDRSAVVIKSTFNIYKTNLTKLGAIIGDDSQTGCNCVLNPGTLFRKKVNCYPCVNIGGLIDAESIVKNDFSLKIVKKNILKQAYELFYCLKKIIKTSNNFTFPFKTLSKAF